MGKTECHYLRYNKLYNAGKPHKACKAKNSQYSAGERPEIENLLEFYS
jgi:hypothetical protein